LSHIAKLNAELSSFKGGAQQLSEGCILYNAE
jgi:hypothetical protein